MTVTIYSTTTCPYCKMLKDYLLSKGISFTEKLVDQDEVAQKEMIGYSGGFPCNLCQQHCDFEDET